MGRTYPKVIELLTSEVPAKKSRNQFCRETGINPNSFDRYKAGISEPTTATLERLGAYFGVEVDYLRSTGVYAQLKMDLEGARGFKNRKDEREKEGKTGPFDFIPTEIIARLNDGTEEIIADQKIMASELISKLEVLQKKYGNVEVLLKTAAGTYFDINSVTKKPSR